MKIHLKTAFDYIKRSPFQALAALFVFSLTFFVGTMLAVMVYSSANLLAYFETRPQIIAFLKDGIAPEQISALQNRLTGDIRVKDVRYVSKEEALEIYKQATSDNPLLSELVSPTIFPASLEFSVSDLRFAQEVINEVKKEGIVDSVGFTASLGGEKTLEDVVGRLRTLTSYLKIGGGIFVAVLAGTSFLIILVIMGMRIASRRGEIEILSMIGATPAFIRSPITLEALIYSSVGAFVGWLAAFLIWLYATPSLINYFGEIPILPQGTLNLFGLFAAILAGELLLAVGLALLGSYLAVSRARRNR